MATLTASKWGKVTSNNQTTHSGARDAILGAATQNPTGTEVTAIEYLRGAARGRGSIYRVSRVFYYFNTSAITGTVSSATLNIKGTSFSTSADVIVVPSTAFSGDGSTNLANTDIANISFNTNYSNEYTGWTSSTNSITLKSQALSDIQNNNYFICAVIEYDHDYLDTAPSSNSSFYNSVDFASANLAYLDYTEAAGSDVATLNGLISSDITSFNTIAHADIEAINGITFR